MQLARLLAMITLVAVANSLVMAQGAVNAFIPDSDTRCINPNRDYVWVKMLDMRASKSKGFLAENSSLGVLITTTATGASGQNQDPIKFPSMAQADVKKDAKGALVLPLQLGLVTQLQLKSDQTTFTEIDFDVKLLQKKAATQWGSAIQTLAALANDLPLPASPYTTGARYFSKYANAAVEKSLEVEKPDEADLKGRTVLQFKPSGSQKYTAGQRCAQWAQTGTYLILDGAGPGQTESDGFVDVGRLNDYCWLGEYDSGFSAKWTKRGADACDQKGWTALKNAYIPVLVLAVDTDDISGASGKDIGTDPLAPPDVQQSIGRCKKMGVLDASKCLNNLSSSQPASVVKLNAPQSQ